MEQATLDLARGKVTQSLLLRAWHSSLLIFGPKHMETGRGGTLQGWGLLPPPERQSETLEPQESPGSPAHILMAYTPVCVPVMAAPGRTRPKVTERVVTPRRGIPNKGAPDVSFPGCP